MILTSGHGHISLMSLGWQLSSGSVPASSYLIKWLYQHFQVNSPETLIEKILGISHRGIFM